MNEYRPEYLLFSPNIGKTSARAEIARMFPGETVIGFSDDDMLFYANWFEDQLRVLDHFPGVGVVSGWPVRVSFRWGIGSLQSWANYHGAKVTRGRFIPDSDEWDYALSVGLDPDTHLKNTAKEQDVTVTYRGLTAYATAQHCQFIAYGETIAPFCEFEPAAMGEERTFDKAIDTAGLLRLTTIRRGCRHMGNVIDSHLREELDKLFCKTLGGAI
jgi:hypothetical protein